MTWFKTARSPMRLEQIACGLVYALLFLTPLFFLPFTLDVLEINKQTLLVLLTLLACLAWLGSLHASRIVSFRRGLIHAAPLLFLLVIGVASGFSQSPYLSWIGSVGQQYTSFLSVLCYVAVFYLVANLFADPAKHGYVYAVLLLSSLIAGIVGLLSLFGVSLPFGGQGVFNTIGTVNAFSVFLSIVTVLGNAWYVAGRGHSHLYKGRLANMNRVLTFVVSLITLAVLILLDYWVLWVIFLAGLLLLFVFIFMRAEDFPDVGRLTFPSFLAAFALLFLFWFPSPVHLNIPMDVTPSFGGSWSIALQTTKLHPLLGSGPGTYSFDYSRFHDASINSTNFWNVRFDRAISFLFLLPPTVGWLGTLGWLVFTLWLFIASILRIARTKGEEWLPAFVVFGGWFTALVATCLYGGNTTILLVFFALSGLLVSQLGSAPTERKFGQSPRLSLILSFAFILISVGAVTIIFVSGQRYAAELAFTQAVHLDQANADLDKIIPLLDRAATINRFDDIYYRNLAQALLLKSGKELNVIKDAPQVKPEDRQRVQSFIAASVNASVRATELSPSNAANWFIRGSVYREFISLVDNAGTFASDAFDKTVELEPANPGNFVESGRTDFAIAEAYRALTGSKDEKVKKDAQEKTTLYLGLAEQRFNQAIKLKPDYSPAHYQLALVKERQGKLDEAIGKMESVVNYNPQDVGVAFQLGLLYMRRGGKEDATRAQGSLEYAVKLLPSFSNAHWFLASIYEQQGSLDKAIAEIQKVAALNPNNDLVKSRLERLKSGTLSKTIPPSLEDGSNKAISVPTQPTENKK